MSDKLDKEEKDNQKLLELWIKNLTPDESFRLIKELIEICREQELVSVYDGVPCCYHSGDSLIEDEN
jgi:hypothetical protein